MNVYVSKNGKVSLAVGEQPKDALLFAPAKKSATQLVQEDLSAWKISNSLIQERFAQATQRQ
ncbi:hypothetical protein J4772_28630 [Cohnella sp. LGH]|uniref:Uncharacterized protein n=1 Tax=Cohnella phaseoli TaxID=456490 RepID=A0A3D9IR32_9BACL|nr:MULTISPECIES: hypothetical protein [Cohnella]QTH41470.1 hypothetical protein J4772_28630 [Cohnella sp. LGH]RED63546.1 hypothetical protein DFP98_12593 [Cohnella phaseoli]